MRKKVLLILAIALLIALGWGGVFYWKNLRGAWTLFVSPPEDITKVINTTGMPLTLAPGFSISIFAKGLAALRVLTLDPSGTLIASITSEGKVVALPDKNGNGIADETITVADNLKNPHGLAFKCENNTCSLFIAESNRVSVYDYDKNTYKATFVKKIADLPDGGEHFTRTLGFGPDGRLYVSIGSSCNVCNEEDRRRAKIFSMNADGSDFKEFASGLRNAVFFTWNPLDGKMWATEMGRDFLGDNLPPDELNVVEQGKNYGWPICYGKNIHDTNFDKNTYIRNPCQEPFETQSYIDIPAHSAPLGLAFIPEEGWPREYWHNLLVAYHGSWNRSVPTGYKIVRYKLDSNGKYLGEEDFITGWLAPKGVLGRPVDILAESNGVLYISDDRAGVVYRVSYNSTPKNADKSNFIRVSEPIPGAKITSPLTVAGEARGQWYFEATFPIKLLDENGEELGRASAQAQSEWTTTNFVPFRATFEFKTPKGKTGTLVLEKDNPSGLPEHADGLRIPIKF